MAVFHLPQEMPKTHKASLLQNSCCGSRGSSGGRFTVVWAENHGYHRDTRGTTWGHHGGIRCNLPFYWYIDVQYIVYSGDIRISNWSTGYELWVCLKLCKKNSSSHCGAKDDQASNRDADLKWLSVNCSSSGTSWSRPTRYPLTSKSHQKTSWNHPVEPLSHSFKENPTRFGDVPWNLRHRKNLKDGWHWKPISKNWLSWMFVHLWVPSSYFSLQTEMVFFPRPDPRKSDIKVIITSNTEDHHPEYVCQRLLNGDFWTANSHPKVRCVEAVWHGHDMSCLSGSWNPHHICAL